MDIDTVEFHVEVERINDFTLKLPSIRVIQDN